MARAADRLSQPLSTDAFYLLEAFLAHPGHHFGVGESQLRELTPALDRARRRDALAEVLAAGLLRRSRLLDGTTQKHFLVFDICGLDEAARLIAARYAVAPLGLRSRPSSLAERALAGQAS